MTPAKQAAARKWVKITAGKKWRFVSADGRVLGFVVFSFNGWDGYVCTGKKWPEGDKHVNRPSFGSNRGRSFWEARRAVEAEVIG